MVADGWMSQHTFDCSAVPYFLPPFLHPFNLLCICCFSFLLPSSFLQCPSPPSPLPFMLLTFCCHFFSASKARSDFLLRYYAPTSLLVLYRQRENMVCTWLREISAWPCLCILLSKTCKPFFSPVMPGCLVACACPTKTSGSNVLCSSSTCIGLITICARRLS